MEAAASFFTTESEYSFAKSISEMTEPLVTVELEGVRIRKGRAVHAGAFATEPESNYLFFCRPDGVVPLTVKLMPRDGYRFLLLAGDFYFRGAVAGVEFAADS
jgi:hypothetical protein